MNHIIYKGTILGIYYNNKDSISGGKKRDTITEKLCSYQCEIRNNIYSCTFLRKCVTIYCALL